MPSSPMSALSMFLLPRPLMAGWVPCCAAPVLRGEALSRLPFFFGARWYSSA